MRKKKYLYEILEESYEKLKEVPRLESQELILTIPSSTHWFELLAAGKAAYDTLPDYQKENLPYDEQSPIDAMKLLVSLKAYRFYGAIISRSKNNA